MPVLKNKYVTHAGTMLLLACLWACMKPNPANRSGGLSDVPPLLPNLRVMTFNIRFAHPDDGVNRWTHRKQMVASVIRFHGADLAGLQEALRPQIDDLAELLPEYAWFGVGRDDGGDGGEFSPVFYRKSQFTLVTHATFWLSEQPQVPGSRGWDAALPRIVTWGKLRDLRTGREFYIFNTHFDHIGQRARRESARLLLRKIAEIAPIAPVVLTGDFNAGPAADPYRILTGQINGADPALQDAYAVSETPHHGPAATFTGFEPMPRGDRIDYIFINQLFRVKKHGTLADRFGDRWPSDHFPVFAELEMRGDRQKNYRPQGSSN